LHFAQSHPAIQQYKLWKVVNIDRVMLLRQVG